MPESNTDFTYLSVLRELEKEVAKLAGKEAPEAGAELTRANTWFRDNRRPPFFRYRKNR